MLGERLLRVQVTVFSVQNLSCSLVYELKETGCADSGQRGQAVQTAETVETVAAQVYKTISENNARK